MTAAALLALVEEYGQAVGWGNGRHKALLAQIDAAVTRLANAQPVDEHGNHVYLSTGCLHAQLTDDPDEAKRLHNYCQAMTGQLGAKRPGRCKHCESRCTCRCHITTQED